jgi:AhpD family alkylhydroperoxidase
LIAEFQIDLEIFSLAASIINGCAVQIEGHVFQAQILAIKNQE